MARHLLGAQPVCSVAQMNAIDAEASEPVEVLIERAGAAVAHEALQLLGGVYGRRVAVICGPGNNGADGRVAARRLEQRGVRVHVIDALNLPDTCPRADLIIDAAFGTGFRSRFECFETGTTPVLAVDIASGLNATTGRLQGNVLRAVSTVTFAALKPGHLLGDGPAMSGNIVVADIGLDVSRATMWHATSQMLIENWPRRPRDAHKWNHAVWCIGGSSTMRGALGLVCAGAQSAGASYVQASTPGLIPTALPIEATTVELPLVNWWQHVAEPTRHGAVVVGPGMGRNVALANEVVELVRHASRPVVVDADALWALGQSPGLVPQGPRVLTPHDGEYVSLMGHPIGDDRVEAVHAAVREYGSTVLLKGPTTIVGDPDGRVGFVTSGSSALATAGSGDVLSGIIGALIAQGLDPFDAAMIGADAHGRAGSSCGWLTPTAGGIAQRLGHVVAELLGVSR